MLYVYYIYIDQKKQDLMYLKSGTYLNALELLEIAMSNYDRVVAYYSSVTRLARDPMTAERTQFLEQRTCGVYTLLPTYTYDEGLEKKRCSSELKFFATRKLD